MKAKLITNKSNIKYLSNFDGSSGFMVLTPKKNYLITDFRYLERAKKQIPKNIELVDVKKVWRNMPGVKSALQALLLKEKITSLGVEEDDITMSQFRRLTEKQLEKNNQIKFFDISGEIEKLRQIKTPEEIKKISKSQSINEKVLWEIIKIIKHRRKNNQKIQEIEIAWKIREIAHGFGIDEMAFDPIVAFGSNSAIPHHSPTPNSLKKSDTILIDMGMKYEGYCSDMTRTFFIGKTNEEQRAIYDLVLKAQENALQKIKIGMSGEKADSLSRSIIEKAGYGANYGHSGGHGLGLDIHEIPSLAATYSEKLQKNMIVTVEPGIYLTKNFGVRIEDLTLITTTGNKNLTKFPKEFAEISKLII